jgi:hypothetical protein
MPAAAIGTGPRRLEIVDPSVPRRADLHPVAGLL